MKVLNVLIVSSLLVFAGEAKLYAGPGDPDPISKKTKVLKKKRGMFAKSHPNHTPTIKGQKVWRTKGGGFGFGISWDFPSQARRMAAQGLRPDGYSRELVVRSVNFGHTRSSGFKSFVRRHTRNQ